MTTWIEDISSLLDTMRQTLEKGMEEAVDGQQTLDTASLPASLHLPVQIRPYKRRYGHGTLPGIAVIWLNDTDIGIIEHWEHWRGSKYHRLQLTINNSTFNTAYHPTLEACYPEAIAILDKCMLRLEQGE